MTAEEGRWDYVEGDDPEQKTYDYDPDELEKARQRMNAEKDVLDKEEDLFTGDTKPLEHQKGGEDAVGNDWKEGDDFKSTKWYDPEDPATQGSRKKEAGSYDYDVRAGEEDEGWGDNWGDPEDTAKDIYDLGHPEKAEEQVDEENKCENCERAEDFLNDDGLCEDCEREAGIDRKESERDAYEGGVGSGRKSEGKKPWEQPKFTDTGMPNPDYREMNKDDQEYKDFYSNLEKVGKDWFNEGGVGSGRKPEGSPYAPEPEQIARSGDPHYNPYKATPQSQRLQTDPALSRMTEEAPDDIDPIFGKAEEDSTISVSGPPANTQPPANMYDDEKDESPIGEGMWLDDDQTVNSPTLSDVPDIAKSMAKGYYNKLKRSLQETPQWEKDLQDLSEAKAGEGVVEKVYQDGWEFSVIDSGYGGGWGGTAKGSDNNLEVAIFSTKLHPTLGIPMSQIKGWLTQDEVDELKRAFQSNPESAYKSIGGEAFQEDEHPRGGDPEHKGRFSKGGNGGDTGGKAENKLSSTSDKDLIKSIKGGSKDWHEWGRNEKTEDAYAEIERRNREIPTPKLKGGDKIFRDDPDAVSKMEQKVKFWEERQDYWKKVTKFPNRDYQTPNQLGDAKWFELSNVGANLRDAKKKLEGIKAQQGRGTNLVRKPTYKGGKKRFYYSEEPSEDMIDFIKNKVKSGTPSSNMQDHLKKEYPNISEDQMRVAINKSYDEIQGTTSNMDNYRKNKGEATESQWKVHTITQGIIDVTLGEQAEEIDAINAVKRMYFNDFGTINNDGFINEDDILSAVKVGESRATEEQINSDTYYYDYSDYWNKGNSYVRSGLALQAGIPTDWAETEWDDLPADIQAKIRDAGYVTSYETYDKMSWDLLPRGLQGKLSEGFTPSSKSDWDTMNKEDRKDKLEEVSDEEIPLLTQLLDNELEEEEEGHDETEDIALIAQLIGEESYAKGNESLKDNIFAYLDVMKGELNNPDAQIFDFANSVAQDFNISYDEAEPLAREWVYKNRAGESYAKEVEHDKCPQCNFETSWKEGDSWQETDAKDEMSRHLKTKHGESLKKKLTEFEDSDRPVSPNTLQRYSEPIDLPTGKNALDQTYGVSEPETPDGQDLTGITIGEYDPSGEPDAMDLAGDKVLDFFKQTGDEEIFGIEQIGRDPEAKLDDDRDWLESHGIIGPEDKMEQHHIDYYKKSIGDEEIIEKKFTPPKILFYKQYPFGRRAGKQNPFGEAHAKEQHGITLDTMNKAHIWWDNKFPERPWSDMRIGDRQHAILAFLNDPHTKLSEAKATERDIGWTNKQVTDQAREIMAQEEFGKSLLELNQLQLEWIEDIMNDYGDTLNPADKPSSEAKEFESPLRDMSGNPYPTPTGIADCTFCGKVFDNWDLLGDHITIVHNDQGRTREFYNGNAPSSILNHPDWTGYAGESYAKEVVATCPKCGDQIVLPKIDPLLGEICPRCGGLIEQEDQVGKGEEGGAGSGRKQWKSEDPETKDKAHIGWKNYGIDDYIDKAEKEYLKEEDYRRVIDEPRTGDDFDYVDWSQRREEERDTDEKAKDYLEKIKYSIDQGGAKYQRGGEQLEDPTPWVSLAHLAGTTVKDILFPSKEQAGGGGAGGAGGAGAGGAGGNGAGAPSGNGGEAPTNGNGNGEPEEEPSRRIGFFGYGRYRNCPKGQVYRNGKCVDEAKEYNDSHSSTTGQFTSGGGGSKYPEKPEGLTDKEYGKQKKEYEDSQKVRSDRSKTTYAKKKWNSMHPTMRTLFAIRQGFTFDSRKESDDFKNKYMKGDFDKLDNHLKNSFIDNIDSYRVNEGGLGSGKKDHKDWMRAIEEEHTYDFCENCTMITEQVNHKCAMCGKKVE